MLSGEGDRRSGPLAGVRVVELGSLIAGPFAGRLLADFGADVIKVEAPNRPDPMRDWGNVRHRGHKLWWSVQSRNKRCVTLDVRHPDGRELLLDLLDGSAVLIENMRPGTLERLDLAPDVLWERNPSLIVARVSGFGQDGPRADRPGYASVAEGIGGLRHINGYPDQPPPRTGISLGDSLAGLFAAQGILLALFGQRAHGTPGQVVDVSLVESCFAMLEGTVPEYAATGYVRSPTGTRLDGIAPSNIFECGDGVWMIIAANQDTVFRRLTESMGRPELADDPRFAGHEARGRYQDDIEKIVAEWAIGFDSGVLDELLTAAGVPCGPINDISQIFADPMFRARGMLAEVVDDELGELTLPGVVPTLSATPGGIRWPGPLQPGSHNEDVFCGTLDLSPDRLGALHAAGVI